MKNRLIVSVATIILGVIAVLIPRVIFPVCESTEMKMSCYYSSQAVTGVGIVIVLLGIAEIFGNSDIRLGISIAQIFNAILILALPLKLTGLCKMESMACRRETLPAWIVVSTLLILINAINVIYYAIKKKRNEQE